MQRLNFNIRLVRKLVFRYTLVWLADSVSIAFTAFVLPGIYFLRETPYWFLYPAIVALIFGLMNALVRPILILLLLPITFFTLGLATLLVNAALFYFTHVLIDSFVIVSFFAAVVGLLVLTLVNTVLGNLVQLGDDYSFYATLMNKVSTLTRRKKAELHDSGVVVLQIDGLSHAALKTAIRRGKMPFLSDMLKRKQFAFRKWFSDLPSQTSAVQAGIFYGSGYNIPGYRWYDKRARKLVVSSSSSDMSAVDDRFGSTSEALLKDGTCISTLLHGGANKKLLTVSALTETDIKKHRGELEDFAIFSLHPYLYTRMIFLTAWDFVVDRFQAAVDFVKRRNSRIRRSIKSSVMRALGNTSFRETTTYFLIEDIVRGVPIIYANYFGYDIVAHYSGPKAGDALSTLTAIDRQIKKISRMIRKNTSKHFDLVILSDHGQSRSIPFRWLYGNTISEFIEDKFKKRLIGPREHSGDVGYLNTLLREMRIVEEAYGTKRIARSRRTLERLQSQMPEDVAEDTAAEGVVVCPSGNLAHIYFTDSSERLTTEQMLKRHPDILQSLVEHPGIGFILTIRDDKEILMMGKKGLRMLRSGSVDGEDPLLPYTDGHNTVSIVTSLARLSDYPNSGDVIINGGTTAKGEVISFEEQLGSHGGLGGEQTEPFVIYPRRFRRKNDRMTFPADLHRFLMGLLNTS